MPEHEPQVLFAKAVQLIPGLSETPVGDNGQVIFGFVFRDRDYKVTIRRDFAAERARFGSKV